MIFSSDSLLVPFIHISVFHPTTDADGIPYGLQTVFRSYPSLFPFPTLEILSPLGRIYYLNILINEIGLEQLIFQGLAFCPNAVGEVFFNHQTGDGAGPGRTISSILDDNGYGDLRVFS